MWIFKKYSREQGKDVIHIVGDNGEYLITSESYANGTVFSMDKNVSSKSNILGEATLFQITDEKVAKDMFVFLSQNTNVEWGFIVADNLDGGCSNFIGTNHENGKNNIKSIVTQNGFLPDVSIHNHLGNNNSVSLGNHYDAIFSESLNRNVHQFNYTTKMALLVITLNHHTLIMKEQPYSTTIINSYFP